MMKLLSRFIFANRKFYLGAGLFMLILFGGSMATVSAAGDCDDNSIIHCGFSSSSNFISTVKSGNSGNGHTDLQPIYSHYGLAPADYTRFVTSARAGTAYRDGRIVVDGQVVATNARSVGRLASFQGPGFFSTAIPGAGTLYGNTNDKAFAASTTSLPVTVMFNSQGAVEFAVMNSCGNPIYGTNVTPSYSCDLLHKSAVAGQDRTFRFTTDAHAGNNASIVKVVYTFGDGSTKTVTSPSTPVIHTYPRDGSFTAKVTVYVSLPGNQTITVTSANCATTVVVATPFFSCVQLGGAILDARKFSYSFTASARFGQGATFKSADFDFGDKNSTKNVLPNGTTVTTTHKYAVGGNYTVTATLFFVLNGNTKDVKSVKCTAKVTPTQPPTPECRPGVPEGSTLCSPCQYDSSIPASDSEHCVAPATTLPNTGAGDVIAIFGAAVVGGFLIFRQFIYKKHRFGSAATMTAEGMFVGPVVSEDTGVVVSHHVKPKHARHHRNAVHALHHPTYQHPHRFRPTEHKEE